MLSESSVQKKWDTIVIGGGQAGLAAAYYLKASNRDFVILDASEEIGDSWRNRWDTLRVFTPNWANALPGFSFPSEKNNHAGKDEVASYLKNYARKFNLPVLLRAKVYSLTKSDDGYLIECEFGFFRCDHVIVATGSYAKPKIPAFAQEFDPGIYQLHSSQYKRPDELPQHDVLVIGAGTSGIQISIDVASSGRRTFLSGKPPGKIPDFLLKYFGKQMIWAMNHIMTIDTKPGRKAAHDFKINGHAAPLIKTDLKNASAAGVIHLPKIKTIRNGYPLMEDGRSLNISSIIWCTGYSTNYSWIRIDDTIDENGFPIAYRGVSKNHDGLYFVGSTFQYALTSTWINGVGRDAEYVVNDIENRNNSKIKFFKNPNEHEKESIGS